MSKVLNREIDRDFVPVGMETTTVGVQHEGIAAALRQAFAVPLAAPDGEFEWLVRRLDRIAGFARA